MNFCDCPHDYAADPAKAGPLFSAGVCLFCGRLHEESALFFLTTESGANFSLNVPDVPGQGDAVAEWLDKVKAKLVETMLARLADIRDRRKS